MYYGQMEMHYIMLVFWETWIEKDKSILHVYITSSLKKLKALFSSSCKQS